jgi:hypothetical protein
MIPRRSFLKIVSASGVLAALGDLGFLTQLPSVSAAEAALEPCMARFHPEIEPLGSCRSIRIPAVTDSGSC